MRFPENEPKPNPFLCSVFGTAEFDNLDNSAPENHSMKPEKEKLKQRPKHLKCTWDC